MNNRIIVALAALIAIASFLLGQHSRGASHAKEKLVLYYVDPMHPSYRSDHPGTAPDCGMTLEPVYEGEQELEEQEHAANPAGIVLTSEKRQLLGVQVETVHASFGTTDELLGGRVVPDENAVYRIIAGTDGQVRTLGDNAAGTLVRRGQVMATVFTSDFLKAQQTFIFALKTLDRVKSSGHDPEEQIHSAEEQLRAAEGELRTLGMSDLQIQELGKKRELTREIQIASPAAGVVLSRNITPDQRLARGEELYRIANLDRVWILADLPEDLPAPRPGTRLRINPRGEHKGIVATVASSVPLLDPSSRTLKLRLEADNRGLLLRPDMFVELEMAASRPRGISVARDAVLDSGRNKIVYLETSEGVFEPRTIEVGSSFANRVIVKSGLHEGDRIVTSGNFMIDSETRMKAPIAPAPQLARAVSGDSSHSTGAKAGSTDPVCGMALSEDEIKAAKYTAVYQGETFTFCSDHCLRKFKNNPESYTKQSQREAIASSGSHGGD